MSPASLRLIIQEWLHPVSLSGRTSFLSAANDTSATARGTALGENNSDPQATGKEIYSNPQNLPTAIASIMNHAQNRADFHPASVPPDQLAQKFNGYVTEVDKTPFFHLEKHDSVKQSFYSKDYNKLIDQISGLYDSVSSGDRSKIKDDITDMAKSVFSDQRSEQWRNLFSQSTIDFSDIRRPKLFIYYTTLRMKHDSSGKSEVNEQEYTVSRTEYTVLADLIRAYASNLASLDKKSVDDWLTESTTQERANAKLCFK
jgi:hypothetical protein